MVALVLAAPGVGNASGTPALTEVDARDAAQYAAMFGVSIAEADRRLTLQAAAGELESAVRKSIPETFGGLWLLHEPDFAVVVASTAAPDEAVVNAMAEATPLAGSIEFRVVSYGLQRLEADAEAVAATRGTAAMEVSVNAVDNRVDVRAVGTLPAGTILPPTARVKVVDGLSLPAANIYGGLPITGCTSGFSVSKSGTKGIVTAGHCGNSQSYAGSSLPFQAERFTGSHDEQWHTAPGFTVTNLIRDQECDPGCHTRSITSRTFRGNQPINGVVCKYGTVTHYTCGTLVSKTFFPIYVPNANGTFMLVHKSGTDLSTEGDSGGPVFLSYSAYGIVSGSAWTADGLCYCDLIYTAVDYVEAGLGVTVLTQ